MTTATTAPTTAGARPAAPGRLRGSGRPGAGRRGARAKRAGWICLFLLPSAIPLLAFTIGPMLGAAWISLHEWNLLSPMQWVGLDNFADQLGDPATRNAFGNTLAYILGYLPLVYVGGLALALALNARLKGRSLLRGIYFLPVVSSWIVVALVWRWLLNPSVGVVNWALGLVGIDGPGWWTDPAWAMPSIVLASAWKDLGFVMVILLAGLQAIPTDVIEAARVDGAGWWRRLRSIVLPLLSPSTFFVVVISLINGFQVFDQVYAMTGGGPDASTETVVLRVHALAFRYGEAGGAAALSWLLFAVILAVTVIQVRGQKRWVTYA
ncbi:carbohydrate ABC transporter permease [Actinotalea fermentans]|uniref:Sugar ABC transporter permease n=1 Tax=Actinotalea fermentans TaxID=43671 RepID=A0A511YY98_9CELL|nr:sugar ABC transporter permease [Actinotalea fermentans]GEN80177.1 sugar ABC transporter permease [Actinotalea fermentans]